MQRPTFHSQISPIDYTNDDLSSFANFLEEKLNEHWDSLVTDASLDVTITYRRLNEICKQFAKVLQEIGLCSKDIVHIYAENSILWAVGYIAAQYQNLIASCSHATSPVSAINRNLEVTKSSVLIASKEKWDKVKDEIQSDGLAVVLVCTETKNSQNEYELSSEKIVYKDLVHFVDDELNDVCQMAMTSGSTGVPKVILMQNRYCIEIIKVFLHPSVAPASKNDVVNAIQPFPHVGGFNLNFATYISVGAHIVIMKKFDNTFFDVIRKYKVQHIFALAGIFTYLSTLSHIDKNELSFVETILTGGALQGTTVYKKVREIFGEHFNSLSVYGLSESVPLFVSSSQLGTTLHNAGLVCPNGEYKLVDINDNEKLANPGEICVKGTPMFKCYFQDEEKTRNSFTSDGFFKTGDFGFASDNGELEILSRTKEIIKFGDQTIFPVEIENYLNSHPSVHLSAVVAKKHSLHGEIPVAFVVLKSECLAGDLIAFIEKEVPDYKRLHYIKILDEMPLNNNKKIDKLLLRKNAETCFDS